MTKNDRAQLEESYKVTSLIKSALDVFVGALAPEG